MGKFKMTDMDDGSLVLGVQVTRDRERGTLTITQENYTKFILDMLGMGSWNPLSTPGFSSELSVKQPEETLLNAEDKYRYQAITGSVMYLAQIPCYEIMYSTSPLARAMSIPVKIHMGAAKHLLVYLSGTKYLSITYKKKKSKTHIILRLQLGQQSGQRKIHVIVHHDDGKGAGELKVGTSKPHCHVDHGGRARCCGTGEEEGDILHEHDGGAGIQI